MPQQAHGACGKRLQLLVQLTTCCHKQGISQTDKHTLQSAMPSLCGAACVSSVIGLHGCVVACLL